MEVKDKVDTGTQVQNKIELKGAKLDKELKLTVSYVEKTSEGDIHHTFTGAAAVHDDLRLAFNELAPHAAKLCEVYNKEGKLNSEKIAVRGISISDSGYVFTFLHELSNGKKMTMNTPLLHPETAEDVYPEIEALREAVITAGLEVRAYVFTGKKAADLQGDMFAEGEEN